MLLTVEGGAITTLEAYPAPDFAAPIPRDSLPGSIGEGAAAYVRDDL